MTEDRPPKPVTVVCAAIKHADGRIICGVRHMDLLMHAQIRASGVTSKQGGWFEAEQGFVDSRGQWLSREHAWTMALTQGQIKHRVGGDDPKLYSENLY